MRLALLALAAACASLPLGAKAQPFSPGQPLYLYNHGPLCAPEETLAEIERLGSILQRDSGPACCPYSIIANGPEQLPPAAWEVLTYYLGSNVPSSVAAANCSTKITSIAEHRTRVAALTAERQAKEAAERATGIAQFSSALKAAATFKVCALWGSIMRREGDYDTLGARGVDDEYIAAAVLDDAKRRRIRADLKKTRGAIVAIGDNECQAFASWGMPKGINTTVTAGGSSDQLVYGSGRYLYLHNGIVKAMQY